VAPADPDEPDEPRERLQISKTQILASSLAAASAAVLCSLFGVAGTIIGTAIASILFNVGSAVYAHSMRRTKARLRRLHQAGAASPPLAEVVKTARQQGRRVLNQIPWRVAGAGAGVAFIVAIGVVTAVEAGIGEPLSALFGVSHSGGRTTTVGSLTDHGAHRHHKAKPTPTPTPPSPTATPTVTKTVTVSPTPTHSPSKKPSHTAKPTHSPTSTPTVTPTTTPTGVAT
jgi:hypothetical protein